MAKTGNQQSHRARARFLFAGVSCWGFLLGFPAGSSELFRINPQGRALSINHSAIGKLYRSALTSMSFNAALGAINKNLRNPSAF